MNANNAIIRFLIERDRIDDLFSYSAYMFFLSRLSIYNSAVLLAQRDGVGFAASELTWLNKYGRMIKPGANPLVIMRPFGPLDLYYETCDTYHPKGRKLPHFIETGSWFKHDISYSRLEDLLPPMAYMLMRHGIFFREAEMGERLGGTMEYTAVPIKIEIPSGKSLMVIHTHYAMVVNKKASPVEKVMAVFHEVGHLLCGHLPKDKELTGNKKLGLTIPGRDYDKISIQQREHEAETTCRLILNSLGFKYDDSKYLKGYLVDGREPEYDMGVCILAADRFLKWMDNDEWIHNIIEYMIKEAVIDVEKSWEKEQNARKELPEGYQLSLFDDCPPDDFPMSLLDLIDK